LLVVAPSLFLYSALFAAHLSKHRLKHHVVVPVVICYLLFCFMFMFYIYKILAKFRVLNYILVCYLPGRLYLISAHQEFAFAFAWSWLIILLEPIADQVEEVIHSSRCNKNNNNNHDNSHFQQNNKPASCDTGFVADDDDAMFMNFDVDSSVAQKRTRRSRPGFHPLTLIRWIKNHKKWCLNMRLSEDMFSD
jgi:hypothetical protein